MAEAAASATGHAPVPTRPLLHLAGVTKAYDNGTLALDSLSLEVRRGEFLTLLGPSGCGKSTVLRLIAGLLRPSGGHVVWDEADRPGRRDIGFVFQEPTLMPWATAFENVYLPLKLRGMARGAAAPRVNEALRQVGLSGAAAAYPRELSGGMKMRVSIARALATDPAVLLMDEPFAALDEINRFRLNQDLLAIRQGRDMTVIFVTHSIYESVFLSDRVAVMAAGPGRITSEIAIDLPSPRDDGLRTEPLYNRLCRQVSQALQGAMRQ